MAGFVATSQARSLTTSTSTRVAVLPPPPVGGIRTVERLRGEFDENLPTLRLPRIGARVLLRDVAAARRLALAELSQPSDGVPIAIVPDTTRELSSRDLEIDEPDAEAVEEEIEIDESAQVDTSDLWPIPTGPIVVAPPIVTSDVTAPRVVMLRERTAEYPRVAMPVTSVAVSLAPLLQASLGAGYDETAVLELEPRTTGRWRGAIWGFAAGLALAFVAAAMWQPQPRPVAVGPTFAELGTAVALVRPHSLPTPPRLVPIGPPAIVPIGPPTIVPIGPPTIVPIAPIVAPASQATPPSPPPVLVAAVAPSPAPKRVRSRARRSEPDAYVPVVATPVAAPIATLPANDGAALLRDAERAFGSGRHATALLYADRSRATTNDPRATRIAALAACRLRRVAKAEAAWLALPLGQRTSVRNACREHGVELGAPKAAPATTPRS